MLGNVSFRRCPPRSIVRRMIAYPCLSLSLCSMNYEVKWMGWNERLRGIRTQRISFSFSNEDATQESVCLRKTQRSHTSVYMYRATVRSLHVICNWFKSRRRSNYISMYTQLYNIEIQEKVQSCARLYGDKDSE